MVAYTHENADSKYKDDIDNISNEPISNERTQTSLTGTLGSFGAADSTDDDKLPVGLFDI